MTNAVASEIFPGVDMSVGAPSTKVKAAAVNNQDLGAGTARTLVTGSLLAVPNGGLQVGAKIKYKAIVTKTAAGTASSTIGVGIGATGTTTDTDAITFATGTQTAAVDTGVIDIEVTVTSLGTSTSTGHLDGVMILSHNLQATGFGPTSPVVVHTAVTNADLTAADALFIGLYITEGTANDITVVSVEGSIENLSTGNAV